MKQCILFPFLVNPGVKKPTRNAWVSLHHWSGALTLFLTLLVRRYWSTGFLTLLVRRVDTLHKVMCYAYSQNTNSHVKVLLLLSFSMISDFLLQRSKTYVYEYCNVTNIRHSKLQPNNIRVFYLELGIDFKTNLIWSCLLYTS